MSQSNSCGLIAESFDTTIIPKPLPPVTADPLPVPTPLSQRQGQQNQKNAQITTNNFKRRHSATDGKTYLPIL